MSAASALILKQMIVFKYNISHMQADNRFLPFLFLEDPVNDTIQSAMYLMKGFQADFPTGSFLSFLWNPHTGYTAGTEGVYKNKPRASIRADTLLLQGQVNY